MTLQENPDVSTPNLTGVGFKTGPRLDNPELYSDSGELHGNRN